VLFDAGERTTLRRVRRRIERLDELRITDAHWSALGLPVKMAFFVRTGESGAIALFPSPAGAIEAWLPPDAWAALVAENAVLADLEQDVEALLVSFLAPRARCFRVSIDVCYALVGVLRRHWRGISGGPELWGQVDRFFASPDAGSAPHA
jgi:hypothetical protein